MERPSEIVWFERIILATLALGVIQSWLAWSSLVRIATPSFVLTTQIFTFAVMIALTLLISRRRSNVAKWISIGMFLLGLPLFAKLLMDGQLNGGSQIIRIVQIVGQLIAFGLLFTPNSRNWFKRDKAVA